MLHRPLRILPTVIKLLGVLNGPVHGSLACVAHSWGKGGLLKGVATSAVLRIFKTPYKYGAHPVKIPVLEFQPSALSGLSAWLYTFEASKRLTR